MEALLGLIPCFGFVFVILLFLVFASVKVVQEYERGVIFRLGRFVGAKGPGLFFIIPFIDKMMKVDLRTVTLDVPTQEAISRDNVTLKVNAVVYFRVMDPGKAIIQVEDYQRATWQIAQTTLRNVIGQSELDVPTQEAITRDNVTIKVNAVVYFRVMEPGKAIIQVEDYQRATWQIAQTTLRNVIGQSELDELLANREKINQELQQIIDEQTEPWGIKVSVVEIKDVELPQTMQRAMARQAEAEREKRAKVIHAQGERDAAEKLADAAEVIGHQPAALQLRYLQTLTDVAAEKNSTLIFPIPVDTISAFMNIYKQQQQDDSK